MKSEGISKMQKLNSDENKEGLADKFDLESHKNVVAEAYSREFTHGALIEMAFEHTPQAMVVCDSRGKIVLASAAARNLALMAPEGNQLELAPCIWGDLFDRNGVHIPAEEWPSSRALCGEVTMERECQLARPGSLCYNILFSAAPITMDRRLIGAVALMTDITRQNQAERTLREKAIRRERSNLAADIHDTLAQSLSAIVLQLMAVEDELPHSRAKAQRHLQRAKNLARQTLAEARCSIWTLSHEALENEDLGQALSVLVKQLFAATTIEVELSLQREPFPLSSKVRLELLRLAREALVNVLKHSRASEIHIQLAYELEEMQLCVRDNGRGFEPSRSPSVDSGFGLISMRRRAEILDGRLVIDTQPGQGTRIVALIPMSSHVCACA